MKSVLKSILACVVVLTAGLLSAQSFTPINPPPCDFSDQFYADNGLDSASAAELNTEADGRFGTFRQTGPPATGSQVNWKADPTCATNNPDTRNFRILATTGGNSDDNNSPFTCSNAGEGSGASPGCANQPGIPETLEFISILAFIHNTNAFTGSPGAVTQNYSRTVGAINGGLDGQQQNAGNTISITAGTDFNARSTGINVRSSEPGLGISQEEIVSNFEAYAPISQFSTSLNCPATATPPFTSQNCTPVPGQFSANPCSLAMIQQLQNPSATTIPQPCFQVADSTTGGVTLSDVATPNLRQNWRFATNRNAMDGSDNNCINNTDHNCKNHLGNLSDSPFGYFCDDLLGMWILTYFWFTQPPNTQVEPCKDVFAAIGAANGFNTDGTPIILTAFELNTELEANNCGAEGKEDAGGTDGGAVWLVCPALPDPRNGAIASDAFLDAVKTGGVFQDSFMAQNFTCLQQTGKFCFESSPEQ